MIQYLIKRGARVNADVVPGPAYVNTPLMMAAMQGHQSSAVLLLRAGADARIRVQNGHTAAELAAKYSGNGMVPLLRCAEKTGPGESFMQFCARVAR
jgi:ankyrin repeat protein